MTSAGTSSTLVVSRGKTGLRDLGQFPQQRTIDGGRYLGELGKPRIGVPGLGDFAQQVLDDFDEPLGIKDSQGLGKRSEGRFPTAQFLADLLQPAGLIQIAQRHQRGVEEGEQDQATKLVEKQLPIPGPVASTGLVVQSSQQRRQPLQEFHALECFQGICTMNHRVTLSNWQKTNTG